MATTKTESLLSVFTDSHGLGRSVRFGAGDIIYDMDTPAKYVYFIEEGLVHLHIDAAEASQLFAIKGPGTWIGAGAMAGSETCRMRTIAGPGTAVREIPIADFWIVMAQHPEELIGLARELAGKFLNAVHDASRFIFDDSNQRLIHALLKFSTSASSTPHPEGIALHLTHEQLAQAVGVARETVSLALSQFRQQNLLRTGRNQLIFNPEVLRKFAAQYANGKEVIVDTE